MRIALKIFLALYGLAFMSVDFLDRSPPIPCGGSISGFVGIGAPCGGQTVGFGIAIGLVMLVAAWFIKAAPPRS